MDLDRARQHEPAHSPAHRGSRDAFERNDIGGAIKRGGIGGRFGEHVRAACEMHDRRRARDDAIERGVGCRREVRDLHLVSDRTGFDRQLPHDGDARAPGRDAMRHQRAADESVGAGNDDGVGAVLGHISRVRQSASRACRRSATPLRTNQPMCFHPLRAAPPPW